MKLETIASQHSYLILVTDMDQSISTTACIRTPSATFHVARNFMTACVGNNQQVELVLQGSSCEIEVIDQLIAVEDGDQNGA